METNFINEDKEEPSTDNYQSILFISDYYCSRLSSPPNGTPKFMEIWLGFLYIESDVCCMNEIHNWLLLEYVLCMKMSLP